MPTATFWSGTGAFALLATCFSGFGIDVFATAGTLVAAGAGAENCTGGVADADESSLYSHAAPIARARANTDEISEAIVKALKLTLLPAEKKAIEQPSTTNPEAYKLYLMARQYNATGNSRHRGVTVRLYQRALEIDPNYARAWALLSVCQSNKVLLVTSAGDTGWDAAERALALPPDLAEAHAAKGRVLGDAGRYGSKRISGRSA